ncbi:MAG: DoxX family protein [bacterium]
MKSKTLFGHFSKCTNQQWFATVLIILRVVLGAMFLYAGITKLGDWSAAGYLAASTGPFAEWFQSLAGNTTVDALNVWGLILIGACLILGVFVRPASLFAIIMMVLYYLADFEGSTAHGLIDEHVIYLIVFLVFLAGGVGHMFGLDGLIADNIRRKKWFTRVLFG